MFSKLLIESVSGCKKNLLHPETRKMLIHLQHAGYAALNFGTFKSHLPQADIVDGLDSLAPSINLSAVNVAGCCGVTEEQG